MTDKTISACKEGVKKHRWSNVHICTCRHAESQHKSWGKGKCEICGCTNFVCDTCRTGETDSSWHEPVKRPPKLVAHLINGKAEINPPLTVSEDFIEEVYEN